MPTCNICESHDRYRQPVLGNTPRVARGKESRRRRAHLVILHALQRFMSPRELSSVLHVAQLAPSG